MKQLIISLLIIAAAQSAYGQTADDIFCLFKDKPNAEYVHIPRLLTSIARIFACNDVDKDSRRILSRIHSVRVLDLEDCDNDVKKDFIKETRNFNTSGYEPMIHVNDSGEKVTILTKTKQDIIREMLILVSSPDDYTLVQLKGEINQDDIDNLIEENTKKNK